MPIFRRGVGHGAEIRSRGHLGVTGTSAHATGTLATTSASGKGVPASTTTEAASAAATNTSASQVGAS
jgi:hypothetical protein